MFRLEMLPAACGDCLWIEYGKPPSARIVIIDGGVKATARTLLRRIEVACAERNSDILDVELLVVTHIDNDHILGIIELLKNPSVPVRIKDIWFNGRHQLNQLRPPEGLFEPSRMENGMNRSSAHEFLGWTGSSNRTSAPSAGSRVSADEFLGPRQGDELSTLLEIKKLPWNQQAPFNGGPIVVPEEGKLPVIALDGGMKLTLLGPSLPRLQKLKSLWDQVRRGDEDQRASKPSSEYLTRNDEWPPVWHDGEQNDNSAANGSSIMLLAAFEDSEILLSGDAYANDIAKALDRIRVERSLAMPLPLKAFKLPHHGSAKNVTHAVLDQMDCSHYLVSTDGSTHGHPDNQALLRILRHSMRPPVLVFNYASETTQRWGLNMPTVIPGFPSYTSRFPAENRLGACLELA